MKKAQPGFTLVELLIVIVILAILAAIIFVAYGNIRNRAVDSAVQSTATQAAKKLELFRAQNDRYPNNGGELFDNVLKPTRGGIFVPNSGAMFYCYDVSQGMALIGFKSSTGTAYVVKNGTVKEQKPSWDNGIFVDRTCTNQLGLPVQSSEDVRTYVAGSGTSTDPFWWGGA